MNFIRVKVTVKTAELSIVLLLERAKLYYKFVTFFKVLVKVQ
jgi:hypothetical protein